VAGRLGNRRIGIERQYACDTMHLVDTSTLFVRVCIQGAWLHMHPPDTHGVRTFPYPTPPGSPVELSNS